MDLLLYICILNTLLFLYLITKQFIRIINSPPDDDRITLKTVKLTVSLSLVIAMWLGYLKIPGPVLIYFFVVVLALIYKIDD